MKQQLVSIEIQKSAYCGFDLCPKKFKYLGNPQLLEEIFTNQIPVWKPKQKIVKGKNYDPEDNLIPTECLECNEEFLLPRNLPVCINCRRYYH